MLVALVMGAAGGCVSGGSATTSPGAKGGGAGVVVGPDGAPTPSTTYPIDRELPFGAYAEPVSRVMDGGQELDEADFAAVEELVSACMKDEGFEYYPRPYVPADTSIADWTGGALTLPVLPADRGDVEKYGYGTDDVEALEAARIAAEAVDENNVYLDGLEPPAQEAYLVAMGGTSDTDRGCYGDATLEVLGEDADADLGEAYTELVGEMMRLVTYGVDQDPRGVALVDEWTQCMADAGYDVTKPPGDPELGWPAGPMQAYDRAIGTAADGSWSDEYRDTATEDIPMDRRFLVGSDAEHAIAVADFDCRASTDFVDRYVDVLADLEADFVADRKVTLDELVAATSTR